MPPIPKYKQIIIDMIVMIDSGELGPGDPLPSASALRARYSVSITPVQQAMTHLKARGYVTGVPGVRVFVADNPPPPLPPGAE